MNSDYFTRSLEYHSRFPAGKIGISLTKPCKNKDDLSLAYTPGVGKPCLDIQENPDRAWDYTNKGNTVAVISDGTAVLGLGNIGPLAGLPVMEGKSVLFKKFADIDAYPLCMKFKNDVESPEYIDEFCNAVLTLEPSLGGINLEDIKGPQCFEILEKLTQMCEIPVFHDDQDGTGIIIMAGVLNALKIVDKKLTDIKIVINGAGAAGIACGRLLVSLGVSKNQIFMCDSKGLITTADTGNKYKTEFAQDHSPALLGEVIVGADLFIGVSFREVLKPEMVRTMNSDAIIFAVANPIPEIMPELAFEAGARIVGTGRSDYANQVNNSLGFPGLFRATLDTKSSTINQMMKMAATQAIASLVFEPATGDVLKILEEAYPEEAKTGIFSRPDALSENYVIPKQFDLRVVPRVARAVAEAAMQTGVAKKMIDDLDRYEQEVMERVKKMWV